MRFLDALYLHISGQNKVLDEIERRKVESSTEALSFNSMLASKPLNRQSEMRKDDNIMFRKHQSIAKGWLQNRLGNMWGDH